jgi:hypothetical protein
MAPITIPNERGDATIFNGYVCGLGFRIKNISSSNKEYSKTTDVIINPADPKLYLISEKADAKGGSFFLPNLSAGFRVCYTL